MTISITTTVPILSKSFSITVKECDRLALVTYDTNIKVQFNLTNMDDEQKEKTKDIARSLTSGSSTNLSGGLLQGGEWFIAMQLYQ